MKRRTVILCRRLLIRHWKRVCNKSYKRIEKINGALITPFLLKRINTLTGGESSRSNVALIKNNAKIGAQIAVEL